MLYQFYRFGNWGLEQGIKSTTPCPTELSQEIEMGEGEASIDNGMQ